MGVDYVCLHGQNSSTIFMPTHMGDVPSVVAQATGILQTMTKGCVISLGLGVLLHVWLLCVYFVGAPGRASVTDFVRLSETPTTAS